MSKRDYWGPTAMPGLRRGYVKAMNKLEARETKALLEFVHKHPEAAKNAATTEVQPGYTLDRWILAGLNLEEQVKKIDLAPLYWVKDDMARMALDASRDIPSVVWSEVEPSTAGLMCFEKPLPPVPGWVDYPIDGVCWYHLTAGDGSASIEVEALVRGQRVPAGFGKLDGPLRDVQGVSAPLSLEVFFSDTMLDRDEDGVEREVEMPEGQAAFLAFVASTMHLMMQPTVAHRKTIDARTGAVSNASPESTQVPVVTLIDLRPLRQMVTEREEGDGGRTYHHRWIVRGHWRNQRVGQDRAQTRATWIPSYIKGPEGAPLLATEKVMVWRR